MSNDTNQAQPEIVLDKMNQTEQPPENLPDPVESKRKRALPVDDWLPSGWTAQERVRTSGTKAGMVDKFYFEPVTMRKFRSRNEVLYYLENGTPKKHTKKAENGDLKSQNSEGRGSSKRQPKSNKKANAPPPTKPLDFDFLNIPDKVIWTGTTGSEEAWCPFIGDYKIQGSARQDWDRAFNLITSQNDGKSTV